MKILDVCCPCALQYAAFAEVRAIKERSAEKYVVDEALHSPVCRGRFALNWLGRRAAVVCLVLPSVS
jgi:hypothetical protein